MKRPTMLTLRWGLTSMTLSQALDLIRGSGSR
jgi:hypothetical protein